MVISLLAEAPGTGQGEDDRRSQGAFEAASAALQALVVQESKSKESKGASSAAEHVDPKLVEFTGSDCALNPKSEKGGSPDNV